MGRWWTVAAAGLAAAGAPAAAGDPVIARLDLAHPFATRTPWLLTVTQSPVPGETGTGDPEPGVVTPCLHRAGDAACDPALAAFLETPPDLAAHDLPHFLLAARIVDQQRGGRSPLLEVALAGSWGGNSRLTVIQALAYDRGRDRFVRVFQQGIGSNHNEEVRFLAAGPLRGDVVTAVPTQDAPFAYRVTVERGEGARPYRPILRYRSATRYGDANGLAVIDSEMPNILRRLGRWRPGQPLPLPAGPCPRPHLKAGALWCA